VVTASPSEIKHLLENTQHRAYFDPMCERAETVQTVDEATAVVYFLNRRYMVTRDFCVLRHSRITVRVGAHVRCMCVCVCVRVLH
jgi:hypothetical protein